MTPRIVQIAPK